MRVEREEMQPEPLSLEARHSFFLQLATLFASGCSLSQSLEAVGQSDKPGELQRVAVSVLLKLERGSRLSSALASEQGHFTRFFQQHIGAAPSQYRRVIDSYAGQTPPL